MNRLIIACVLLLLNSFVSATESLQARNLPPDNKVLFFIGQNSDDLAEYKASVLDKNPDAAYPGGVTLYTALNILSDGDYAGKSIGEPLDSILGAGNWGDGEHSLRRTLADYPSAAIAIGLDLKDNIYPQEDERNCRQQPIRAIAATNDPDVKPLTGQYHKLIDTLIHELKQTQRPIFLRIGYEFDGPWNCYKPESYIKAFRYIKSRIDALQADNIATVWQSGGAPSDDGQYYSPSEQNHFEQWYPGDDVVDWVGLSTFLLDGAQKFQVPNFFLRWLFMNKPSEIQQAALAFARARGKPVMLAEAAPMGYDNLNLTVSAVYQRADRAINSETIWSSWYASWFELIEQNKDIVRAAAYINTHWSAARLWRCDIGAQNRPAQTVPVDPQDPNKPACPGGIAWGDSRIHVNQYIFDQFQAELKKSHFYQGQNAIEWLVSAVE